MDSHKKFAGEIYNLSQGPTISQLLDKKKRQRLKASDEDYKGIHIIQDFNMPDVSTSIQITQDQASIFVTGSYKPRVKCFDINNISMKFERCMDSEIIKFALLSENYRNIAFLQNDRHVEFHDRRGSCYRSQIPFYGRDLIFVDKTGDLYIVGTSSEILRIHHGQMKSMPSIKAVSKNINCCAVNHHLHMFTIGSTQGLFECWDTRESRSVGQLLISKCGTTEFYIPSDAGITYIKHLDSNQVGIGTSTGQVLLFDLRSNKLFMARQQAIDCPIKKIDFSVKSCGEVTILSADDCSAQIWNKDNGETLGHISPDTKINDVLLIPDTGLVCVANESPTILSYFAPALGGLPKWCGAVSKIIDWIKTDDDDHGMSREHAKAPSVIT